jgi:hypothetical protein
MMDINWQKTKIMFISKKANLKVPKVIFLDSEPIEVVTRFKLLGVDLDNLLKFNSFVGNIKSNVNKRLFAIKRLFYVSFSIKVQFFKTFILPYFDYCFSLIIHFGKTLIS